MRTSLVAVAILGSALAACGDDADDSGAAATTTTAGATTTPTTPTTASTATGQSTTSSTSSGTTTAAGTLECGTVGFTPNSEDAASSITATGVSCDEATSFVKVAGRQTSSGGPQEVAVQGYSCVRTRSEQEPLPQAFYDCTKGSIKISFVRS